MVVCTLPVISLLLLASIAAPSDSKHSEPKRKVPAKKTSSSHVIPDFYVYYEIKVEDNATSSAPTSGQSPGRVPDPAQRSPTLVIAPTSPPLAGRAPIGGVAPKGDIMGNCNTTPSPRSHNPRAAVPDTLRSNTSAEDSEWSDSDQEQDDPSSSVTPKLSLFLKVTVEDTENVNSSTPMPLIPAGGASSSPNPLRKPKGVPVTPIDNMESTIGSQTLPTAKPRDDHLENPGGTVGIRLSLRTTSQRRDVTMRAVAQQVCAMLSRMLRDQPTTLTWDMRRAELKCGEVVDKWPGP